jgi:hypothetical protein
VSVIGGKIAYIDTENKRGLYYANEFDYDYMEISAPYRPEKYIDAMDDAINGNYSVVIVDSATHEWAGKGGILDDKNKMPGTNEYVKWGTLTPRHNNFLDKLLYSDVIVIVCLRGKDEYIMETNDKGKQVPRKVGMGPQQRDGIEYETTCSFLIDQSNHIADPMKDNTHIFDGTNGVKLYDVLTEEHGRMIMEWANSGEVVVEQSKKQSFDPGKATRANKEQIDAIVELMEKLGWNKDKINEAIIEKTGKKTSADLTYDDACVLIAYMGSLQSAEQ